MSVWAVIPAKDLRLAKSRLAPVLSPGERAALAERLLRETIGAARACPELAGVVVVSAAPELRRLAEREGALALSDPPPSERDPLNAALERACRHAALMGATASLILPADLPLLRPAVIVEFLDEAGDAAVAIAPDRAGSGTNTLLLRPPLVLAPAFGSDSFARHRAAAHARGLSVVTIRLPALSYDLDTPDDLALLGRDEAALLEPCYG
jgi:2-phospho-L-lactate guanylyltransferase